MNDASRLAAAQLARMRGMTRYYHQRFFSDVRFSTAAVLVLLVLGWWEVPEAFLLVPVVALLGAAATAFDASYLIFARQYAARLEGLLNEEAGREVLVASQLESAYLFPLDERKIVVAALGGSFTWGTAVQQSDCSSYGSAGLQLEATGSELNGVARRASTAPPCGSGGRVLVQQGTMSLTRAF